MGDDMTQARARSRAVWSAGNWDAVSRFLAPAGEVLLDAAGVGPGMDVLDVGCGSGGTVAIPAALRGAAVVGADVAPEHFEHARRRAAEAGVEIEWVEADAAELPLADDRFDRVLSTFGHAFAPDQAGAAHELVRVCRPGGRIVAAMWTPEGYNGAMFATVARHLPPPAPGLQPPIVWGTEERWLELVGSLGVALDFRRAMLVLETDDEAAYRAAFEANFGPLVVARRVLGDHAFAALQSDLADLVAEHNTAPGGALRVEAEYLVAVGSYNP